MQPFLTANLGEVGNLLLQAGKGTECMCKRLKPSKIPSVAAAELTGGQEKYWPHSHMVLSFALSPGHPPLVLTPWAALSIPLSLPLQGAPGRMGAQGDPGLKGYQVRGLFSSPSFYLFRNTAKLPLQHANCS